VLKRLHARLVERLTNPDPDGHRCDYCTRAARYGFRLHTSGSVVWQLLTTRVHYGCTLQDHWSLAAGAAARAVAR
jgi:hypothetical protein